MIPATRVNEPLDLRDGKVDIKDMFGWAIDRGDVRGQTVLYALWSFFVFGILGWSFFKRTCAPWTGFLQAGLMFFGTSLVLQCARYALLYSEEIVPLTFRLEIGFTSLFHAFAIISILFCTIRVVSTPSGSSAREMDKGISRFYTRIASWVAWFWLFCLAALMMGSVVFEFVMAISSWWAMRDQKFGVWRVSDKDDGLTWTRSQITAYMQVREGFPQWKLPYLILRDGLYFADELETRFQGIRITVSANALELALVVYLLVFAFVRYIRSRGEVNNKILLYTISLVMPALLLSSMFRLIVQTNFVLNNFRIIRSAFARDSLPDLTNWLPGYRVTCNGFPVVKALLEPLGFSVAALGLYLVSRYVERLSRATEPTRSMAGASDAERGPIPLPQPRKIEDVTSQKQTEKSALPGL